jgi:trk system potassium uptake protein TrkH
MVNFRYALNQLGLLFCVLSLLQLLLAGWSFLQATLGDAAEPRAAQALLISAGIGVVVGGLLWLFTRTAAKSLERREALLMVALSWFAGAALAGAPFLLWARFGPDSPVGHPFASPVNCYFEAMSGLTTTGATILNDIASLPRSLLLWRATTHWLGGLGIVVLFVAVLPTLGAGGKKLFRVEAPGPEPEGVRPHIRETAQVLWLLYLGLTLSQIVLLRLAGMNWFDSVCHTFATLATGGFSTADASIAAFNSWAVHLIIIVFMFLAGVNFGLYYKLIRRDFTFWRDTEFRVYVGIILLAATIITLSIAGSPIMLTSGETVEGTAGQAIRHGLFTTVAIQTTTGFCTADFDTWPYLPKAMLIVLMFCGASAGSTGGGIKIIRIWIIAKVLIAEVERAFRPYVVRPIKIGKTAIDAPMRAGTLAFVLGFILIFAGGTFGIITLEEAAGQEITLTTAGSASAATLFNIGPGLGAVGASKNYLWFSEGSKLLMSLLMAVGRLEIFAVAVLFFPRYWSGD